MRTLSSVLVVMVMAVTTQAVAQQPADTLNDTTTTSLLDCDHVDPFCCPCECAQQCLGQLEQDQGVDGDLDRLLQYTELLVEYSRQIDGLRPNENCVIGECPI